MNISKIYNCYGCGVCATICPHHIISMELNKDGFYEPQIKDIEQCTQCGLCFPVCPEDAIPVGKEDLKRKDFNYDYCKGCGVCAKVCPFGAIEMREEGVE